jgi:hypothetical protein
MNEDIADGLLIDLRCVDMSSLLTDAAESDMRTALDRILAGSTAHYNGFNNIIE